MINIFVSLLLLIASYSFFSFSFIIHGLDRLIVNAPLTIFEYCVVMNDNEVVSYIDEEIVETKYRSYIEKQVDRYVDYEEVDLDFRFYYSTSGGRCYEDCDGVEVSFSSYIAFSYTYNRTMFYEIKEANHG